MSSIIYTPTPTPIPTSAPNSANNANNANNANTPTLYLFIINARHLSIRRDKIKAVVKQIADLYKFRVIPKFIINSDPVDIEPKLSAMNDRFSYAPCGIAEYDKLIEVLNIETLSNIFKHNDIWQQIVNGVYQTNDIFMVIEDDVVIVEQNLESCRDLLEYASNPENNSQWDMLFPGLSQPINNDINTPITLKPVMSTFKIIPSKESYIINKNAAKILLNMFNESKITYSMRIQLSKYLLTANNNIDGSVKIKAMIPNRRCTVDGSKLGFFPTTLHNNNILLYNGEYMELFNIYMQSVPEIKKQLGHVKHIYNLVKHLSSPDITHIYAIILMKAECFDEAENYLQLSLDQTKQYQGILNNRCDICNNIINLYEKLQTDISTISKNPSKYTNYKLVPLKD